MAISNKEASFIESLIIMVRRKLEEINEILNQWEKRVSPSPQSKIYVKIQDVLQRKHNLNIDDIVEISLDDDYINIKPRKFLGDKVFSDISEALKEFNAEWFKDGKQSRWRIKRGQQNA